MLGILLSGLEGQYSGQGVCLAQSRLGFNLQLPRCSLSTARSDPECEARSNPWVLSGVVPKSKTKKESDPHQYNCVLKRVCRIFCYCFQYSKNPRYKPNCPPHSQPQKLWSRLMPKFKPAVRASEREGVIAATHANKGFLRLILFFRSFWGLIFTDFSNRKSQLYWYYTDFQTFNNYLCGLSSVCELWFNHCCFKSWYLCMPSHLIFPFGNPYTF